MPHLSHDNPFDPRDHGAPLRYPPHQRCWYWLSRIESELLKTSTDDKSWVELLRDLRQDSAMSPGDLRWMLNQPIDVPSRDDTRRARSVTPLAAYLDGNDAPSSWVITTMLHYGADPNRAGVGVATPLDSVIRSSGEPEIINLLAQWGALPLEPPAAYPIDLQDRAQRVQVDFPSLAGETVRIYKAMPEKLRDECRRFIRQTGSLYEGYVYLRAAEEATFATEELERRALRGERFVELTARVMNAGHPRDIAALV